MTHFWALADDSRVPEVDFVHLLDIWESISESGCLFRPLRFNFMHCGVIRGPLQFYFWLLNVRPYNRVFEIGLWEFDFFSWKKSDFFLLKKSDFFWYKKSDFFRWKKSDFFRWKISDFFRWKKYDFFWRKKSNFLDE